MFNQEIPMNTNFSPVFPPLASSDYSPESTPWNQQDWQAFNQVPDPNNDPETNLTGWRTSILCPSIQAFFPIDIESGNVNEVRPKCPEEIGDIANTTWESQDSILELTSMTSALSLTEHSTLQSKFDWIFYSNMENLEM